MNNFNGHQRSSSGDTHLITTSDDVNTNLQRSRSITNITTDTRYLLPYFSTGCFRFFSTKFV